MSALDIVLRPYARMRYEQRAHLFPSIPKPVDSPHTLAAGPDADRILLFGSGPAVGWGVRTHDTGLAGHLGREVAGRTGRGARVDVQARSDMLTADAAELISNLRTERYEAIVVALGSIDALVRVSPERFRLSLDDAVETLLAATTATTRITLVGVPPLSVVPVFSGALGRLADARATELDRVAAGIADRHSRVSFVPLPTQSGYHPHHRDSADYHAWARLIAVEVAAGVAAASPKQTNTRTPFDDFEAPVRFLQYDSARVHRGGPQDETARLRASRSLGLVGAPSNPRIDRIVDEARQALGMPFGAFTVIGETNQWNSSHIGFDTVEVPRETSYCAITIQDEGALILEDTARDERFDVWSECRFYAGFPVESPSGYRIGAVCVFDAEPHSANSIDTALLGAYAHAIERELWDLSVA